MLDAWRSTRDSRPDTAHSAPDRSAHRSPPPASPAPPPGAAAPYPPQSPPPPAAPAQSSARPSREPAGKALARRDDSRLLNRSPSSRVHQRTIPRPSQLRRHRPYRSAGHCFAPHPAVGAISTNFSSMRHNRSQQSVAPRLGLRIHRQLTFAGSESLPTAAPSNSHPCSTTCAAIVDLAACTATAPSLPRLRRPHKHPRPAIRPTTADFSAPCISTHTSNRSPRSSRAVALISDSVVREAAASLPRLRRHLIPPVDQRHPLAAYPPCRTFGQNLPKSAATHSTAAQSPTR